MHPSLLLCLPGLVAAAQPVARPLVLPTPDGYVLRGVLSVPSGPALRPVVLLAHPFGADRTGWQPLVERLNAKGVATLALDLRGHGESAVRNGQPAAVTDDFAASAAAAGFDRIPADLAQAAAWARRQPGIDPRRVALAGAGLGACAAVLAAPAVRPLALLALSPAGTEAFGSGTGKRLVQRARRARAAGLVLAAQDDPESVANARALQPVYGTLVQLAPGPGKDFALLDGHADTMAGWLAEYLGHGRAAARARHALRPAQRRHHPAPPAAPAPVGAPRI